MQEQLAAGENAPPKTRKRKPEHQRRADDYVM